MPSIRRKPRPRPLLRPGPDRVCSSQTIRRPHPVVGSCSLFDPTRLSSSTGGAMPRGRIQQGRFVLVRTGEMGTGSRSPRSVPVPISPASQSPFANRIKQPCRIQACACILGIAYAALFLAPSQARAQFRYGLGYGYGFGLGIGGFNYRSNQVRYINGRSLLNASRATMGPVPRRVYAGDPDAYYNHLRDTGYIDGYDVVTRREIEARIGRFSDGPAPSRLARRVSGRGRGDDERTSPEPPVAAALPPVRPSPQSSPP
jgi:hypothetical protein